MIVTFLRQEWNPISETKQELDTLLEIIFMVQPSIHLSCIPTLINKIHIQGSYILAWEIMSQLVNTMHSNEKGFQAIYDSLNILVKGMESLSNIILAQKTLSYTIKEKLDIRDTTTPTMLSALRDNIKNQLTNYRQATSTNIRQEWKVFEYVSHIYARISHTANYLQPLSEHVKWLLFFSEKYDEFSFYYIVAQQEILTNLLCRAPFRIQNNDLVTQEQIQQEVGIKIWEMDDLFP